MRRPSIILPVFLVALLALAPAQVINTGRHRTSKTGGGGGTPMSILDTCQILGAVGGTTSAVDTTGANFLAVSASYLSTGGLINLTENKGNGNASALTEAGGGAGNGATRIYYWTNPTVGAGHTFSFTGAFSSVCIHAWSNMATASVFDVENGNAPFAATCPTGAITPGMGARLIISSLAFNVTSTVSIDSSMIIDGQSSNLGSSFGYGGAHLLQTPNGAMISPTWTNTGATSDGCAVAAFKGM